MPTVTVKTKGGTAGDLNLSERVFGAPRNISLMHQAVVMELENKRQDTRNVPGRGDMSGGGRKPFKQKGTGRSRQGSIVAPHWRHGGAAHGPHPRDLGHSMPKKMRRAAILSALSAKLADGELIIVDHFPIEGTTPSTKTAAAFMKEIGYTKKSLVIIESNDEVILKSLRNVAGVTIRTAPAFSTRDVVDGGLVVVTRAAVEKIEATWGGKVNADDSTDAPNPTVTAVPVATDTVNPVPVADAEPIPASTPVIAEAVPEVSALADSADDSIGETNPESPAADSADDTNEETDNA